MKNFGVRVTFKPVLKVTWFGASGTSRFEVDQWRYIDLTDTIELRPQREGRRFVSAYLVEARTGTVYLTVSDQRIYRLLKRALEEGREYARKAAAKALQYGEKPKGKE